MIRFNLALVPLDKNVQIEFQALAQTYFAPFQDGYLLGDSARVHATLCQFYAASEKDALEAFNSFTEKDGQSLALEEFRINIGLSPHEGFFWAAFPVSKTVALLELQKSCFHHLAVHGCKVLTSVETYDPHITIARLKTVPDKTPLLNELSTQGPLAFRPAVGLSTDNGVFVREL